MIVIILILISSYYLSNLKCGKTCSASSTIHYKYLFYDFPHWIEGAVHRCSLSHPFIKVLLLIPHSWTLKSLTLKDSVEWLPNISNFFQLIIVFLAHYSKRFLDTFAFKEVLAHWAGGSQPHCSSNALVVDSVLVIARSCWGR